MATPSVMRRLRRKWDRWVWQRRHPGVPDLTEFYRNEAPAEWRAELDGPLSAMFFANQQETAHKWLHYLPIYERCLARWVGQPLRFIEIGVFNGGSLRMWRNYFGPQARLMGIDIDPDCAQFDGAAGMVRIGSQADPEFLRRCVEELGGVDVVLDDGSHVGAHQRASFEALFPLLSEGGTYLIEDLHTSYWHGHDGGLKQPGTGIEMLKEQIDAMHRHYYVSGTNTTNAIPPIASIQVWDSIAAIEKAVQRPRVHVMVPRPATNPYRDWGLTD